MQVWNVLHAARWKYRTQKSRQKSPSGHHRTTLSDYIFATKAHVDNRKKKLVKQQYVLQVSSQYGELRPTSGWDQLTSLGHSCEFQRVSRLSSVTAATSLTGSQPNFAWCFAICAATLYIHFRGILPRNGILPGASHFAFKSCVLYVASVTARHSSSGHQPNFVALSRGRHLCSAGRPSRWALAHILVEVMGEFSRNSWKRWRAWDEKETVIFWRHVKCKIRKK